MNSIEDGYLFWKQFDALRDPNTTLKALINDSGLNYELIKVQRSLNRIPKVYEVARLAACLNVPVEFLLQEKELISTSHRSRLKIYQALQHVDTSILESVRLMVENRDKLEMESLS